MEESLIQILETFGYPVIRQGSLGATEAYPATFFTFWDNSEVGEGYYDNDVFKVVHNYDINVYSDTPDTTYTLLMQARDALKAEGWIAFDRGHDIASDEITHTGRGITMLFLETIQEVENNG